MNPAKIVLLAKPQGITSFSAMGPVKKAFCRKANFSAKASKVKVGHTGTLDSFADGLLVVLTGRLTRLAPFIEALPKEYRAEIRFGEQTDTLDPTGTVVQKSRLPQAGEFLSILPTFVGKIQQVPPEYSALKQGGKRLSDLAREGAIVSPQAREIEVYQIVPEQLASPSGATLLPEEFPATSPVASAIVRVRCSKGTYIRALARDIAKAANSAAHLSFLRRLSVGPFLLENAAGFSALKPFAERQVGFEKPILPSSDEILSKSLDFTSEIADSCGFDALFLKESARQSFFCGKAISAQWFSNIQEKPSGHRLAVFSRDLFAGFVCAERGKLSYDFVFKEG